MVCWWEPPRSRNDLLWQAKREGAVVSHPCAKSAQGWGTRLYLAVAAGLALLVWQLGIA